MKKKLLTLALLCIFLVPTYGFTQGQIYGNFQFGSVLAKRSLSEVGVVTSGNIPISRDTVKNYMIAERAGYFYQDRPDDQSGIKAAYSVLCASKYFEVGHVDLGFTLGTGALISVQDETKTYPVFKGELSASLYKSITLSFGADYIIDDPGVDKTFAYVGLSLAP